MSTGAFDRLRLTPQQANVVVMEIVEATLADSPFNVPELDEQSQRELWKAKERYMERLRENLKYARKQLG